MNVTNTWTPSGPIVLLAGTPAGGGQDRAARALREALTASGVPDVEVRNVVGRGGGTAWEAVSERGRDGRVVAVSSPTLVTNALRDPGEVRVDDLTHLAVLCTEYLAFVAAPGDRDLGSVLAAGGPVAVATALGNVNHVALAAAARHLGVDPRSLDVRAFGSAREAVAAVVAGTSGAAVVSAASVLPELAAGTVSVVAVCAPDRLAGLLESVPTWVELGVPCVYGTWRGVVGAPLLEPAQVDFWTGTLGRAVREASWVDALERYVWSGAALLGSDAARFVAEEERRLGTALRDLGILDG